MDLTIGESEAGVPSVIVRTRNSASTLQATLAALAAQTVPTRVVIVDSGSTDGTLEIARRSAAEIVELDPATFSYGRALNAGIAAAATGEVVFAVSSHAVLSRRDWLERSLAYYADPAVVAVCGAGADADGLPFTGVIRQDLKLARAHPFWGLTNTAASWRTGSVRSHPFDEALQACEDKEWALRVLALGGVIVVDPLLAVDSSHRVQQGFAQYFRRVRREQSALLQIGAMSPRSAVDIGREWWAQGRHAPPGRRGLTSVTHALDHLAECFAQRDVARTR